MLQGWVVIAFALGYIGLLFVVASYGDRTRRFGRESRSRLFIYPLSLAIYCTSWTFFGSVGLASRTGFDFLTIYLGPILMIGLAWPLIIRIVRLAKAQNITSIDIVNQFRVRRPKLSFVKDFARKLKDVVTKKMK